MPTPRITPYDGSSTPFTIGLRQLDPARWLPVDDDLDAYLDEKARLLREDRDAVLQTLPGSEAAQAEALELIVAHLLETAGDRYQLQGERLSVLGGAVSPTAPEPPLLTAGRLVADDLVVLENRDGGWRVTAGYVSFPSSWSLREKAGKTIGEVHAPVPEFESGSRNDGLINRMFDRLPPGRLVERFNWSIYPDGTLHWPPERAAKAAERPFLPRTNFVRVERQTLLRLPETGAILFTIRIYRDPLATIASEPSLRQSLSEQLVAMTPAQLAYKGMLEKRDALLSFLQGN